MKCSEEEKRSEDSIGSGRSAKRETNEDSKTSKTKSKSKSEPKQQSTTAPKESDPEINSDDGSIIVETNNHYSDNEPSDWWKEPVTLYALVETLKWRCNSTH